MMSLQDAKYECDLQEMETIQRCPSEISIQIPVTILTMYWIQSYGEVRRRNASEESRSYDCTGQYS